MVFISFEISMGEIQWFRESYGCLLYTSGNQKEVRKFLIVSDVYLMTSHYEGISLTTIEALACKIPAILYDVPGLRDFNKEQLCSLLIPEQATEIVKAIKKLRTNSGEKEMIIKNGYETVSYTHLYQAF